VEEDIQDYIFSHIPIVKTNGFEIQAQQGNKILVFGKLKDHINHRNSVFGGSISTALTLAAWAGVRSLIPQHQRSSTVVVIQSQKVEFTKPVLADFLAENETISEQKVARLFSNLDRFGKARITVKAHLVHTGESDFRAHFVGDFVIVRRAE